MSLNVRKFISVSSQLAFEASSIIRDIYHSNDMGVNYKGVNDPVTIADIKIQTMIIQGLRAHWPTIRIVGEETTTFKGEILYDYMKFQKPFKHEMELTAGYKEEEISLDESCVWVDPLDGTKSFVSGDLDQVTTLIGLSYKNKARVGVIGIPYKRVNKKLVFEPRVLAGDCFNPGVYEIKQDLEWTPIKRHITSEKGFSIVTTRNNVKPQYLALMENISDNLIQIAGCGKKLVMMVEGEADSLAYIGSRTSRWDLCAGEALVKAMGGTITDMDGKEFIYDADSKDYINKGGVLGSFLPHHHEKILTLGHL